MEKEENELENIFTYTAVNRKEVIMPLYLGESDITKKVRQYIHVKAVGLSVMTGFDAKYTLKEISEMFPNVQELLLSHSGFEQLDDLKYFTELTYLSVDQLENNNPIIDLTFFPKLKNFRIFTFTNVKNLEFSNIRYLNLRGVKDLKQDLSEIQFPSSLETIYLRDSQIKSLNSIEKVSNLKELHLVGIKKIESTQQLNNLPHLQTLSIRGCKNIDYHNFTTNSNIINLQIDLEEIKGVIPSLNFLKYLPNLEMIMILGDRIITDGDMTPFLELPKLKRIWFGDSKKYSHTLEEICLLKSIEYNPHSYFIN